MKLQNFSIAQATFIVGIFTIGSRLVGLVRARVFTSEFGAGQILDVYYASFRLPDILLGIFILGTLSVAVVPVFTEMLVKSKEEAWKLASVVVNWTWLVLTVVVAVLWFVAPWFVPILVPGFSPELQAATVQLTRLVLAGQVLFGVSNLTSSLLQSHHKFLWPAVAPVLYNLGIIFGVLVLYPTLGLRGLGYGVILGALAHLLVQVPALAKIGARWTLSFSLPSLWRNKLLRLYLPRLFFLDLVQISMIIASVLGSRLAAGSIGVFHLAYDVAAVPVGVFALALAVASFPALSESYARQEEGRYWRLLHLAMRNILAIAFPCSVLLILLRAQAVRLIYGAGEFDWNATILTLQALGVFSISLFAQSLLPIFSRAFFARHQAKVPVLVGFGAIVVNVVVSKLLVDAGLGVLGLVWGFSLSTIILCGVLYYILFHTMHKIDLKLADEEARGLLSDSAKLLAATFVMGVTAYGVLYLTATILDTRTWLGLFVQSSAAGLLGVLVYMAVLSYMGLSGAEKILHKMKRIVTGDR